MGDPFREHNAQKRQEKQDKVAETHEAIVLWVETDDPFGVKKYIKQMIEKLPSVHSVARTTHEPSLDQALEKHRQQNNDER